MILDVISVLVEPNHSRYSVAHSVAFAFLSEEVPGIQSVNDGTFDDLFKRSDDCRCVDAPSIGKAVLVIVGHNSDQTLRAGVVGQRKNDPVVQDGIVPSFRCCCRRSGSQRFSLRTLTPHRDGVRQ